jgi:hypothetical protein
VSIAAALAFTAAALVFVAAVQLPDTGCAPQLALLQVFQQLVELRESGRVLADVLPQQQRPDQQYGDTKDILETWRCGAVSGHHVS